MIVFFRLWASLNIKMESSSEDLSKSNNVVTLLSESNRLGPVEGVYVLASSVTEQDIKKLTIVIDNLDLATRKFCKSLRYVIPYVNNLNYSMLLMPGTLYTMGASLSTLL